MNLEKLNELEVKAQVQVYNDHTLSYDYKLSIEKLAELIVNKCLHIVDDEGCGEGGSIRAMEKIKEHFGV
jgi:hypothetical protein